MNNLLENIQALSAADGVSGDESAVRELIRELIGDTPCTCFTDPLGNLIVEKKGKSAPKNKILAAAHMDEVGFTITYIDDKGRLSFSTVGGVDARVAMGKRVRIGKKKIPGVIGLKPVHQIKKDEAGKAPEYDALYLDIGAESKEEAEALVSLGDPVCFDSGFLEFGSGLIKGKALDDRAGCALLIEMIKSDLEYDCTFAFTVQEETGTTGIKTAAYTVNPDIAIIVETTTAGDISGVSGQKKVCELGNGPVVSFMDGGSIYDRELYNMGFDLAKKLDIPCQTKTGVYGGNDARSAQVAGDGVRIMAISMPARYIHSGSCVLKKSDIIASLSLLTASAAKAAQL